MKRLSSNAGCRIARLYLIALLAASVAGCGRPDMAASGTVNVVAIDVSASSSLSAVRERYWLDFQRFVNALIGGDALHVYAVTANTQATSMTRVAQDFPAYNSLVDNRDQARAKLARARKDALEQTRSQILDMPSAAATDLLHGFGPAAEIFSSAAYSRARAKRLVIFSDMIQQTADEDFLSDDLTDRRDQKIIDRLRRTGQLPSLKGVQVWVTGAAADPLGRVSPAKTAQIRRFWLAYFRACGADLAEAHYGTALSEDAVAGA